MQSGRARVGEWIIDFERTEPQRFDPLTGWPGSGDTAAQVRMTFASREAAIAYAEANGLDYEVEPLGPHTLKLQSYADNFR